MKDPIGSDFPAYSPGEQLAHQFGYQTPTDDLIKLVIGMVALGAVGVVAVGVTAYDTLTKKKTAPSAPVTSSQKIVRVGLVSTLVGAGAYAYFAGKQSTLPSPVPPSPHKPQVQGSFPSWGSYR